MQTNKEKFEELASGLPKANIKIIFKTENLKEVIPKKEKFWQSVALVESFIEEYDLNEKNETAVFILTARNVSRNAGAKFRMVNGCSLMVAEPKKTLYGAYYSPELKGITYYKKDKGKKEYESVLSVGRLQRNIFSFFEKTLNKSGLHIR